MFGSSTPTNHNTSITKRKKTATAGTKAIMTDKVSKQPMIYRIFEDAAEYADDSYWRDRLLAASRGVFYNKTISFDGSELKRIKKREEQSVVISVDDPEAAAEQFIDFHRDIIGIRSDIDIEESKNVGDLSRLACAELSWSNASPRQRKGLIGDYAKALATRESLSPDVEEVLLRDLNLLVESGVIDSKKVVMNDNAIVGLTFLVVEDGFYYYTDRAVNEWRKKLLVSKEQRRRVKERPGCIAATFTGAAIKKPKTTQL